MILPLLTKWQYHDVKTNFGHFIPQSGSLLDRAIQKFFFFFGKKMVLDINIKITVLFVLHLLETLFIVLI